VKVKAKSEEEIHMYKANLEEVNAALTAAKEKGGNNESLQQLNIQLKEELMEVKAKSEEKIHMYKTDLEAANRALTAANDTLGHSESDTMKNIESLQQINIQLTDELMEVKAKSDEKILVHEANLEEVKAALTAANEKLGNSESDTMKNIESLQQINIQLNAELLDLKSKNEENIRIFEADIEALNEKLASSLSDNNDTMKNVQLLKEEISVLESLLEIMTGKYVYVCIFIYVYMYICVYIFMYMYIYVSTCL
jgi:chromosome segregation ATPase